MRLNFVMKLNQLLNITLSMSEKRNSDIFWMAPIGILAISTFPLPIGFYMLSRTIVCVSAIYYGFNYFKKKDEIKPWIYGFFAILYNPLIPVYLNEKFLWVIVNIITIIFFFKHRKLN